ncbi:MAG: hypothetical protein ACTSUE_05570 [Promethearchaeota archaeon]
MAQAPARIIADSCLGALELVGFHLLDCARNPFLEHLDESKKIAIITTKREISLFLLTKRLYIEKIR